MRKKVIVLGGSSGIGKAIAERFAKEGWLVIVSSSNLAATQKVVD
ncbi:MAG: SDR family NAD(P)-dependent oxidoreductase, partial [Bacteroidota bacterium]|nr:SDR family NAD(P)-dependent oxidoreductase [Bacteroidota bacterium]